MGARRNRAILAVLVAAALLLTAGLALGQGIPGYLAWLIGWSSATFVAYGIDKAQARRAGWRIPEIGLHGMALAGGATGGWLGMLLFHHKIRHASFIGVLALATTIQVGLGIAILTRS